MILFFLVRFNTYVLGVDYTKEAGNCKAVTEGGAQYCCNFC